MQVVVLPIFWEQKTAEMKAVMKASENVLQLLEPLGVRCVMDNNNKFTPGQRMKHWCVRACVCARQKLGVPICVEIRPQDMSDLLVPGVCKAGAWRIRSR